MSWAEIKKAINSNLKKPLNELIIERANKINGDLDVPLDELIKSRTTPPTNSANYRSVYLINVKGKQTIENWYALNKDKEELQKVFEINGRGRILFIGFKCYLSNYVYSQFYIESDSKKVAKGYVYANENAHHKPVLLNAKLAKTGSIPDVIYDYKEPLIDLAAGDGIQVANSENSVKKGYVMVSDLIFDESFAFYTDCITDKSVYATIIYELFE